MAILFSQADGSDQHYDTYEEFEKALILLKRLNGEKVPQDLLDEVREKYDGKDSKTFQVEIDVPQDLEALGKAVEAFFKGIDDTEEGVDTENLPIGALVKVVGNSAGHNLGYREILPITEVVEGDELPYRLGNKPFGWVAVEDIEFVSFPEEEESTSGDEGLEADEEGVDESMPKLEVGDTVKVLRNLTEGYDEGTIGKVVEILPSGSLMIESDCGGPYAHSRSALELVEESEPEFKVGDKVRVEGADYHCLIGGDIGTIRKISEHMRHTRNGRLIYTPYEVSTNSHLGQWVAPEHLEIIEEVESEDSEIKAGDTVIATEDEFDITEGVEYEVREDGTGLLYFFDDDDDIRHVRNHKSRLRKKSDKRGFIEGDVVYVKEKFRDVTGDLADVGVGEIKLGSFSGNPYVDASRLGLSVAIEGHEDKLTLVCRAEDRLDK